ncbi:flavocytochrome c [Carnobacteriaceae bacterium zg-ZUI252]|nr:flavocytochrome c [Carnobacteriaceae bacterium zg-ZUI252]QTU83391.1 flavocytochrome c [Carnobacteriaceae bacterium zg-C25]
MKILKRLFAIMVILVTGVALAACGNTAKQEATTTTTAAKKAEAVTGASEKTYTDPKELKDQYDVVIVGSGGAGMAAAISAKDAGANVAIFEKLPVIGGNTAKSSAGMNASETKYQKEQGIVDENQKFFEESLKGGKNTNDKDLLRFLTEHSAAAIDWLDTLNIHLSNLTTTGGMSVKRTHRPADGSAVGGYLVDGLYGNVTSRKIPTFVNADVIDITQTNGAVSGVVVKINGEEKRISAKAVILATGGFGANAEMVTKFQPQLKGYVTTNSKGTTGDGIKLAETLGAMTVDMDQIQIHPSVEQKTSYLITEAVRGEGAILLNADGKRFFNEMETRDKVSAAINSLTPNHAFVVFDEALKGRVKAITQYEAKGFVVKADTIEELAKKLDMPVDNVKASLDTWNKAVANKNDAEFSRKTAMEHDLSKAPFYAIKVAPGVHHTMGGLKINTNTEVLKADGSVIKGLYAAGEVTGGIHGSNRIGGNAVADIIIFGRQAGTKAAEFVK